MRRIIAAVAFAVAAGLGLAACGPPKPNNGQPAAAQQTAASEAVKALFDVYAKAAIGPRGQQVDWTSFRSKDLAARFAALPAKQLASEEPILDFDPVVGGQDWAIADLALSEAAGADASRRVVTATFKNSDEPRTVMFDVVQEDGAWKVDNIRAPAPLDYDVRAIFDQHGVK